MVFRKLGVGGQRPFGTFPKIHPFWWWHLSLRQMVRKFINQTTINCMYSKSLNRTKGFLIWVTTQISVWHSFNFPGCQYWQPVQSTNKWRSCFLFLFLFLPPRNGDEAELSWAELLCWTPSSSWSTPGVGLLRAVFRHRQPSEWGEESRRWDRSSFLTLQRERLVVWRPGKWSQTGRDSHLGQTKCSKMV